MAQQLPTQSQFGDYSEWPGRAVLDSSGQRLGGVREIYLDRETGRPEWVLVDLDDTDARFVPLTGATVEASSIRVAHSADTIRRAPGIGTEPRIDQSEEHRLYAHYGLETRSGHDDAAPSWQARGGEPTPPTETPAADRSAAAFLTDDPPSDSPAPFAGTAQDADAPPHVAAPATRDDDEPAHFAGPATRSDDAPPRGADVPAPFGGGTWSDAAEPTSDAPPPAEPPSPAEIEAAHIPDEPPAASDRATDYETAPFDAVAPPPREDESPPTAADAPPPHDDDPAAAFLTDEEPVAPFAAPSPDDDATPPDTPRADESVAAFLTDDAPLDATLTPHAAPPLEPSWASEAPPPLPQEPAQPGALEVARRSPEKIALAALAAAVLFLIVRRLR